MSALNDVLTKLSEAKEGSRELDAEIECTLPNNMGFNATKTLPVPQDQCEAGTYWHKIGHANSLWTAPHYTASMDAALTLRPEGAEYCLSNLYGIALAEVGLNFQDGPVRVRRDDGNVILALVIAALGAIEVVET